MTPERVRSIRDARGTVLVEFLIAIMPIFVLFLGIVQYALLSVAQLVVQHAAVAGVRAASVVLDDDPALYDGAERLEIGSAARTQDPTPSGALAAIVGQLSSEVLPEDFVAPSLLSAGQILADNPRMAAIRTAVHARLMAIVPARGLKTLLPVAQQHHVAGALGESPIFRALQAPFYLPISTAVTFPIAPGSSDLFTERVESSALVTVRVTHVVMCEIPLVAALMCETLASLSLVQRSSPAMQELAHAPGANFQALWLAIDTRAMVFQAEASMPAQNARYLYASQLESNGDGS